MAFKEILTLENMTINKDMCIASGGYAEIWKCKDVSGQKIYALKEMKLQTP